MKKIIIVGIVILVIEIIFGIFYLFNSKQSNEVSPPTFDDPNHSVFIKPSKTASFNIKTSKNSFKKGETIPIMISLDTENNQTTASDLVLRYDPAFLKPVKTVSPFEKGEAYDKLAYNAIDTKIGIATVSAISEVNKNFTGKGTFANLSFTALKAGDTYISIKFMPGNTTDSNIVSEGKDILFEARTLDLKIEP